MKTEVRLQTLEPGQCLFLGYKLNLDTKHKDLRLQRKGNGVQLIAGSQTLKPCHKCITWLPSNMFYKGRSPCKKCKTLQVQAWQQKQKT